MAGGLSFVGVPVALWLGYAALPRLNEGWPRLILVLLLLPLLAWPALMVPSMFARALSAFILLWVCPSKLTAIAIGTPIDTIPTGSFFQFAIANLLPLKVIGPIHNKPKAPNSSWWLRRLVPVLQLTTLSATSNYLYLHRDELHDSVWFKGALECLLTYSALGATTAAMGELVQLVAGLETAPCFNYPFLAASLSEFWGRRWNLVVTTMLRATIYDPIVRLLTPTKNLRRSKLSEPDVDLDAPLVGRAVGTLACFVVSGLLHEAIFCCLNQSTRATWEVTLFFVIHGFATVAEVFFRKRVFNNKSNGGMQSLSWLVHVVLTLGFMYVTAVWFFLPPVIRTGADMRTAVEIYGFQMKLQSMALDVALRLGILSKDNL